MKLIHLDPVGGVAGDMFVAALLDAFPDLRPRVLADAAVVLPPAAGTPTLEAGHSNGIRAWRFGLSGADAGRQRKPAGDGSFAGLVERIETAPLSAGTAAEALAILTILGEAEAAIHGVALADVHFHEIGDWDSLLDIVAAGSIAAALGGARWTVAPLPRGGGLVKTQHGLLPVPAPATATILTGFLWRDDGIEGERVTPTGAAILKHLATNDRIGHRGRLAASGTGAGTRTLAGLPNVLRVLVFDEATDPVADRVAVVSFEVDDMTGEEIGVAAERLRQVPGVLDLSIGQRWGKKSRPLQSFRILASLEAADAVVERCFAETSTIGLRLREEGRVILARDNTTVAGVGVKSVLRPGDVRTAKAESDDLDGDTLAARRAQGREAEDHGR